MPKLFEAESVVTVQLIAAYLRSHGIETQVLNEHQAPYSHLRNSPHPELWVGSEQFKDAAALVAQYQREQQENTGSAEIEWTCSHCKETNPYNFAICWSCGQSTLP